MRIRLWIFFFSNFSSMLRADRRCCPIYYRLDGVVYGCFFLWERLPELALIAWWLFTFGGVWEGYWIVGYLGVVCLCWRCDMKFIYAFTADVVFARYAFPKWSVLFEEFVNDNRYRSSFKAIFNNKKKQSFVLSRQSRSRSDQKAIISIAVKTSICYLMYKYVHKLRYRH